MLTISKIKTIEELETLKPCSEGLAFVKRCGSLQAAWDACENPTWLFWFMQRARPLTKEQSVKIAQWCAAAAAADANAAANAAAAANAYAAYAAAAADAANAAYAAEYAAEAAAAAANAEDAANAWRSERKAQCDFIRRVVDSRPNTVTYEEHKTLPKTHGYTQIN